MSVWSRQRRDYFLCDSCENRCVIRGYNTKKPTSCMYGNKETNWKQHYTHEMNLDRIYEFCMDEYEKVDKEIAKKLHETISMETVKAKWETLQLQPKIELHTQLENMFEILIENGWTN